jgi:hypothetical protein
MKKKSGNAVKGSPWGRKRGYPIEVAARLLGIPKAEFYGILRAYGVRPVQSAGIGLRGKPPRLLSGEDLDRIRARLKEAEKVG